MKPKDLVGIPVEAEGTELPPQPAKVAAPVVPPTPIQPPPIKTAQFDVWLGITTDEPERVKQELGRWRNRYPLIERRLSRTDCYAIIRKMDWPEPPKSSCWMCPNRRHAAWVDMKQSQPDDWQKAVTFEIRQRDDALYLHRQGVTLPEVSPNDEQGDLSRAAVTAAIALREPHPGQRQACR